MKGKTDQLWRKVKEAQLLSQSELAVSLGTMWTTETNHSPLIETSNSTVPSAVVLAAARGVPASSLEPRSVGADVVLACDDPSGWRGGSVSSGRAGRCHVRTSAPSRGCPSQRIWNETWADDCSGSVRGTISRGRPSGTHGSTRGELANSSPCAVRTFPSDPPRLHEASVCCATSTRCATGADGESNIPAPSSPSGEAGR